MANFLKLLLLLLNRLNSMSNDKEVTGLEILDELYGTAEPTQTNKNTESTVVAISSDDFKIAKEQIDMIITLLLILGFLLALTGGIIFAHTVRK